MIHYNKLSLNTPPCWSFNILINCVAPLKSLKQDSLKLQRVYQVFTCIAPSNRTLVAHSSLILRSASWVKSIRRRTSSTKWFAPHAKPKRRINWSSISLETRSAQASYTISYVLMEMRYLLIPRELGAIASRQTDIWTKLCFYVINSALGISYQTNQHHPQLTANITCPKS